LTFVKNGNRSHRHQPDSGYAGPEMNGAERDADQDANIVLVATSRQTLIAALEMLGSSADDQVLNGARTADRIRADIGMTWAQLIAASIAP
jgi:hypothetical protein